MHNAASASAYVRLSNVTKKFGDFTAVDAVSLDISRGEIFCLLGGSGSGKTTLLRMLAGFARPSAGQILIDGVDMSAVPPYERPVNMMFQSYALFPHMSVDKNVGFGLEQEGLSRADIRRQVGEMLDIVRMGDYGARKPHQLSGGQRQRVALARALIRRPKVLLLDEPLSALDKKLREQTQFELMDVQYKVGITFIVVTHDQDEAMALASRIAVMDRGRVVQVGTPSQIYEFPASRFVADFVGTANLFEGTVRACEAGLITVQCAETGCDLLVDHAGSFSPGQRIWVALRPEKIRIGKEPVTAGRVNQLRGTVWELGYLGNRSTYRIKTSSGKLITAFSQNERRTAEPAIDWSDEVFMSWSAEAAVLLES